MNSLELQVILLWSAVTTYVVATILSLIGLVFSKPVLIKFSPVIALVGAIPHTAAVVMRWIQTGHFPYWGKYEVFNVYACGVVLLYLVVVFFRQGFRVAGVVVYPLAFFLTGIALTGSTVVTEVPSSYLTYWLGIHVAFAKLAFGSALIAAYFGILYLLKVRVGVSGKENALTQMIKSPAKADYYSYRFTVLAFITMTIMIASGAVWGYKAWGRYWAWDPVETWSLVCWILYGIILHLRTTMGWKGNRAAWLSVAAIVIVAFAFFGMPALYETVHEHLE